MRSSRYRKSALIRNLVRQVPRLNPSQMIQPLFLRQNLTEKLAVPGLLGVFQETTQSMLTQIAADQKNGIHQFLLFGVPDHKHDHEFDVQFMAHQISTIRKEFGDAVFLAVDTCLCSYTRSGHCGILNAQQDIDQSLTVKTLAQFALIYAQAGADCIAPSDMMDHRIAAIRHILDQHEYDQTLIMSYAAKFHSKLYGPFREAADSTPRWGLADRSTYQIDPSHPRDAYLSALRDAKAGADILMVKPGLYYLDVLSYCSRRIKRPWAVYEVSGEYASREALAEKGLLDAKAAHLEAWTAFLRAGAQIIISYGSRYAQDILNSLDH